MRPWITGFSGVRSGSGYNPSATSICVRSAAARTPHASRVGEGVNGK